MKKIWIILIGCLMAASISAQAYCHQGYTKRIDCYSKGNKTDHIYILFFEWLSNNNSFCKGHSDLQVIGDGEFNFTLVEQGKVLSYDGSITKIRGKHLVPSLMRVYGLAANDSFFKIFAIVGTYANSRDNSVLLPMDSDQKELSLNDLQPDLLSKLQLHLKNPESEFSDATLIGDEEKVITNRNYSCRATTPDPGTGKLVGPVK